jgi:hypothetical protein
VLKATKSKVLFYEIHFKLIYFLVINDYVKTYLRKQRIDISSKVKYFENVAQFISYLAKTVSSFKWCSILQYYTLFCTVFLVPHGILVVQEVQKIQNFTQTSFLFSINLMTLLFFLTENKLTWIKTLIYLIFYTHLNKVLQKLSTAQPSSSVAKHKLLRVTKKHQDNVITSNRAIMTS